MLSLKEMVALGSPEGKGGINMSIFIIWACSPIIVFWASAKLADELAGSVVPLGDSTDNNPASPEEAGFSFALFIPL